MKYSASLPMFLGVKTYFHMKTCGVFFFARSGSQRDVIFHEKTIHKILLDLLQKIICLSFNN